MMYKDLEKWFCFGRWLDEDLWITNTGWVFEPWSQSPTTHVNPATGQTLQVSTDVASLLVVKLNIT